MRKISIILSILVLFLLIISIAFKPSEKGGYMAFYASQMTEFANSEKDLLKTITEENLQTANGKKTIKNKISAVRLKLKTIDFWLRYLDATAYHKINGPLPVEWETEVFEKYEKPYRREGAGLTLAELYLETKDAGKDSLLALIKGSEQSMAIYAADSITNNLNRHDHFFFANRLFLLNLASIYTTGFECPNTENIIPELQYMLESTNGIYTSYNQSFAAYKISNSYLELYHQAILFVQQQSKVHNEFDHFTFIKNFVNPLFALNQKAIRDFNVQSNNFNDYSLNNGSNSIFSKSLYEAQNDKGVFIAVEDDQTLAAIRKIGKLLFYDPILSANNKRSCASCHKSTEYFTDTTTKTALQFDGHKQLARNTPTLINAMYNHLLMMDGKHTSLMGQAKDVVTNPAEMASDEKEVVKKVLSCNEYNTAFKQFVKLTPNANKISLDHIVSAVILYYTSFSKYYSPFDNSMNDNAACGSESKSGFNIFMSKAKCGTCHFVPQFNGVKPPYISTEFEVVGTPEDTLYKHISPDQGRSNINPATETTNAFRTGTIRNTAFTKPYMHNGIFNTLEQVINFYDTGGGAGKGLKITNQTLASDSLKLSPKEKYQLIAFIKSLNENIPFEGTPDALPTSANQQLNKRKSGGEY